MNQQTAQLIADSYRERATEVLTFENTPSVERWERSAALTDHAAVWQRVADGLKPEETAIWFDPDSPRCAEDGDENGNVVWMRSDTEMLAHWTERPVDGTRWRRYVP